MKDSVSLRIFAIALFAAVMLLVPLGSLAPGFAEGPENEVDLLLALGVDISYSMDEQEQKLQRGGYVEGLSSKPVIDAIVAGLHGRIAVSYYEWAGTAERRTLIPWTIIDSRETALEFTKRLAAFPYRRASRTSVSGAIDYGSALILEAPFKASRKIIDISGDGPNNNGRPVEQARDESVEKNIVINGLPIIFQRRFNSAFDIENLDEYYTDCVIGGTGAFVIPVANIDQFTDATKRKLLREIAGRDEVLPFIRINERPKADCLVGEKQWQRRFGN